MQIFIGRFTFKNEDIYYPVVFIWAYIAIYVNQDAASIRTAEVVTFIVIAAAVFLKIIRMIRNRK
ncbi:MAG: hypothetical protein ACQEWW_03145 [Bacillota bacterium]